MDGPDFLAKSLDFLERNQWLLVIASALSLSLFVVGALVGPYVIARLPQDYFVAPPGSVKDRSPARLLVALARNLVGVFLLLLGLALLVFPGQGLLTILAGVFVMEFPAKSALLRRATASAGVRRSLNWVRRRLHRPPLFFEED